MTTVYLCIGTQKTGTTSLQRFMVENKEALAMQGYCYPDLELGMGSIYKNRNGHFLAYISEEKDKTVRIEDNKKRRRDAYKILAELAKKYSNIVLSDEIIWYQCNKIKDFWPDMLEEFRNINCEVKVVVYLRRQDEILQSLWNQRLKAITNVTQNFEKWMQEKRYSWFPLDYFEHLDKIASYVGEENLQVRVFERGQFEGEENSLLTDYLKTLGITLNSEFVRNVQEPNYGLSGNFIELKRIMNGIPEYQRLNNFLRTQMVAASVHQAKQRLEAKVSMFDYEEQKAFMKNYEEGNCKVAQKFLGREDGILFQEPILELPKWKIKEEAMCIDVLTFAIEAFCAQERRLIALEEEINFLKKKSGIFKNGTKYINETNGGKNKLIIRGYQKAKKILKKEK